MSFTLRDFDLFLPPDLVARGRALLLEGAVETLVKEEAGIWQGEVKGTSSYQVRISLEGREIASHQCSCPFPGDTCKHQVAVLFRLRQEMGLAAFGPG